jgi:osmotically-inducible protein OsmY
MQPDVDGDGTESKDTAKNGNASSAERKCIMLDTASTLVDRIDHAISLNPHLAGRHLTIEAHQGRIRLLGIVNSYYQKQMAQETVRGVEGVEGVENRLQVSWPLPRRVK